MFSVFSEYIRFSKNRENDKRNNSHFWELCTNSIFLPEMLITKNTKLALLLNRVWNHKITRHPNAHTPKKLFDIGFGYSLIGYFVLWTVLLLYLHYNLLKTLGLYYLRVLGIARVVLRCEGGLNRFFINSIAYIIHDLKNKGNFQSKLNDAQINCTTREVFLSKRSV